MRLVIYLNKAKARPIGSVSPDGKYKKAPSGKWLPIKKERAAGSGLESKIKESYNWILEKTGNEFEAMVLLDENGKVLKTRLGDKSSIDVSDMIYALQDGIFLHNHPSGSSFSDLDIWCALTNGMKEIRAFGKEYEYIFRPAKMLPSSKATVEEKKNMLEYFDDKSQAMYDKYQPLVKSGRISAKAASMNHWHEITKGFVKKFGGFYERRDRQD